MKQEETSLALQDLEALSKSLSSFERRVLICLCGLYHADIGAGSSPGELAVLIGTCALVVTQALRRMECRDLVESSKVSFEPSVKGLVLGTYLAEKGTEQ